MPTKQEVKELISLLEESMSLEQIAVELEKGYYTIWRWSKGKGLPDKGDYQLLLNLKGRLTNG